MDLFKNNTITLQFSEGGDFGNEPKIFKSVITKVYNISKKPGYKKEFEPEEIDMINTIKTLVEKSTTI